MQAPFTAAGVDNGQQMRVQGEGAEGAAGYQAGDLYVKIEVQPDRFFKRKNVDLFTEVSVDVVDAILGGSVDVNTLGGVVTMKLPKGTQPETQLSLKGMGVAHVNSGRKGNQYVTVKVKIPTVLTERQVELLEELGGRREAASHFVPVMHMGAGEGATGGDSNDTSNNSNNTEEDDGGGASTSSIFEEIDRMEEEQQDGKK